ncbi:MAG: FAD/NAD(P)-binding protein [Patescibacteria group bacterium]
MRNPYEPKNIKVVEVKKLSPDAKLFRLKTKMTFVPGQFVLAGIWGYGEAPFGPASSPYEKKYIDIIVRNTGGVVTSAMHNLKKGNEITLRGPYGNGFPIKLLKNKDIIMATGGCGIPPIASLVQYLIKNRKNFGNIHLLYGAQTPDYLLLKNEMKKWGKDINIELTIDKPTPKWKGCTGFVTDLVSKIKVVPKKTVVIMCGPEPMTNAMKKVLEPIGISNDNIFLNIERKMQCGIGKCQHCTVGDKYACIDGPVFSFKDLENSWD